VGAHGCASGEFVGLLVRAGPSCASATSGRRARWFWPCQSWRGC